MAKVDKAASSLEKANARDAASAERTAKIDKLPIALQLLLGLGVLAAVGIIGIGVLWFIDMPLLDWDPIGKIISKM